MEEFSPIEHISGINFGQKSLVYIVFEIFWSKFYEKYLKRSRANHRGSRKIQGRVLEEFRPIGNILGINFAQKVLVPVLSKNFWS